MAFDIVKNVFSATSSHAEGPMTLQGTLTKVTLLIAAMIGAAALSWWQFFSGNSLNSTLTLASFYRRCDTQYSNSLQTSTCHVIRLCRMLCFKGFFSEESPLRMNFAMVVLLHLRLLLRLRRLWVCYSSIDLSLLK